MAANGNMMSTGTIGYDALGNKLRIRNFGVIGNETYAVDMLMLFHQVINTAESVFFFIFFYPLFLQLSSYNSDTTNDGLY